MDPEVDLGRAKWGLLGVLWRLHEAMGALMRLWFTRGGPVVGDLIFGWVMTIQGMGDDNTGDG